jgi:hypothetical protein
MQHSHRIIVSVALACASVTAVTLSGIRSSLSAATTTVPNVISGTCHDAAACIRLVNAGNGVAISAEAHLRHHAPASDRTARCEP